MTEFSEGAGVHITDYNDRHTHAEVIDTYGRVIEYLKQEESK